MNNKKSVWIFNHHAVAPDLPGGTRHFDLGKELVKRGYKVTIFASSFHHQLHKETRLPKGEFWKIEDIDAIKFVWIKTFQYKRNDWKRILSMISYMIRSYLLGRRIARLNPNIPKPNVIIGSSVHLLAVLAAYYIAKYYKAKFIMEVRDLWPQTIIDIGQMSEKNLLIKILQSLEKFLYRRAERIITLLPLANEYITSCGINEKKIVWIPNGVDLERFGDISEVKKTYAQFKVMYLGTHGRVNALDVLLDVAKIIQDNKYYKIKFILKGDGTEKKNLISYKNKLKLRNMEFRDPVKKTCVNKILKEADVLVSPMKDSTLYKYGISYNKEFDYMASSKPIILAGNPANNIVEKARCGITTAPEDPEAFASAIIELYHLPKEEREAMGKRGRKYVEKYHSIPVLADKLEKVISEVCPEKDTFL